MQFIKSVIWWCRRHMRLAAPVSRSGVVYEHDRITMTGSRLVSALGLDDAVPLLRDTVGGNAENIIGMTLNVLNNRATASFADVYGELANTFLSCGHADIALPYMKKYLDASPSAQTHQAYLNCLLLCPDATNQELFEAATSYASIYASIYAPLIPTTPDFSHIDFSADRRLRIGYVCEFFDSSVMKSGQLDMIRRIDHGAFETYCYSDGTIPETHRACADNWRETGQLDALELFHQIRKDCIDILVDLSGPTAGNRFETYARRPAPLQMSGPNYAATSGMPYFDFTLAAEDVVLPEEEKFFSETIIKNPHFFGYAVPCHPSYNAQVEVSPPPALRNGFITFGYFGSTHKLNRISIKNWSLILRRVPSSKLILKAGGFEHALIRNSVAKMFADNGIPDDRLEFRGYSAYQEMLAEYADIDIAFDGFPSTGGATLNDLLWQGVPCISLEGNRNLARNGPARLRRAGMGHLVGDTPDACARIAEELTFDLEALAEMRSCQRTRLKDSMLFDSDGFAKAFEVALRNIWRTVCIKYGE